MNFDLLSSGNFNLNDGAIQNQKNQQNTSQQQIQQPQRNLNPQMIQNMAYSMNPTQMYYQQQQALNFQTNAQMQRPMENLQQQQIQMRQASPQKKAAVKVKLKGKEHGFYSNMWTQASKEDGSKVGGRDAVIFFKKSGLPVEKLKEIWILAAKTSNEYLSRDEFYLALRLIAYAQNNINADENSVMLDIDVGLPQFINDAPSQQQAQNIAQVNEGPSARNPEVRAEELAAILPNLDDLDINQLSGINSLIPSIDKMSKQSQIEINNEKMIQMQIQQQQYIQQQQMQMMQQQMQNVQLAEQNQLALYQEPQPQAQDLGFPKPQFFGQVQQQQVEIQLPQPHIQENYSNFQNQNIYESKQSNQQSINQASKLQLDAIFQQIQQVQSIIQQQNLEIKQEQERQQQLIQKMQEKQQQIIQEMQDKSGVIDTQQNGYDQQTFNHSYKPQINNGFDFDF